MPKTNGDEKGLLVIITGLPASGKDTIAQSLLSDPKLNLNRITTYATREMREGEVNGEDYNFVTNEQFHILRANGVFLEHVKSGTTWKATPAEPFTKIIKYNHRCIWRIDPYRSVRTKTLFQKHFDQKIAAQLYKRTVTIFINVSDKNVLKKRWLARKKDEDINQFEIRFNKDSQIVEKIKHKFDYIVNNDGKIEEAVLQIKNIIRGKLNS